MKNERAEFLLNQAFDEDEQGNEADAAELYMEAAELCIELVSVFADVWMKLWKLLKVDSESELRNCRLKKIILFFLSF